MWIAGRRRSGAMKELTIREACALIGEGKYRELEFGDGKTWWRAGDERGAVYNCASDLRIRHNPPLPEPKKVPLTQEDVLVTTQFREKGAKPRSNYSHVTETGVCWWRFGSVTSFDVLMEGYERTDDSGRTWHGCWKMEGGAE
jgi:hypothetical protein